jgi:D-hydroxyproline dehydrogenase
VSQTIGVIGAGVIGVACARALQRAGRDVVLFDPLPPGSCCSAGNAGHIALDHIRPLARPDILAAVPRMLASRTAPLIVRWRGLPALTPWLTRFALAAHPRQVGIATAALSALLGTALADWQNELELSGLSSLLRQQGGLNVVETRQGLAALRREANVLDAQAVPYWDLSPSQVVERLPGLSVSSQGGRLFPQSAHVVDPLQVVASLAKRFVADGGTLIPAPVTDFEQQDTRITGVNTPNATYPVSAIVLASGVATAGLARRLRFHLPLTAERGYHVMIPSGSIGVEMPVTFNERGFVVTPMAKGIRLAGTVELGAGQRHPDWSRADIFAAHVRALFGKSVNVLSRWHGDRPTLPDYLPAIGHAPGLTNVLVAAGHQHLGLTLAAVTARIVASLAAGRAVDIDLRPLSPARFHRR